MRTSYALAPVSRSQQPFGIVVPANAGTHSHRQMSSSRLGLPLLETMQACGYGSPRTRRVRGDDEESFNMSNSRETNLRVPAARMRPSCALSSVPPEGEGTGKAGCWPHPWSACNKKARGRTTGSAETARPSLRNGFNGLYALSPVTGLFCHRRLADRSASDARLGSARIMQGLAPASGRQDHTTSPSAPASLVLRLNNRSRETAPPSFTRATQPRPSHSEIQRS